MTDQLRQLLLRTTEIFRGTTLQELGSAEWVLTFLLWKFLSDTASKNPISPDSYWVHPGKNFNFDNIYGDDADHIKKSLTEWKKANKEKLSGLFNSDVTIIKNLTKAELYNLRFLWRSFFDKTGSPSSWKSNQTLAFFDVITEFYSTNFVHPHLQITPKEIVNLIKEISPIGNGETVCDPNCRSGSFLTAYSDLDNVHVTAETNDLFSWKLTKIQMIILSLTNADVIFKSTINFANNLKYDLIITNPPFGQKQKSDNEEISGGYWSKILVRNRTELIMLTEVLDHLSKKGRAAIIMPANIISGSSYFKLRKKLIEENTLEGVIILPPKLFYQTGMSAVILLINNERKNNTVLLIDAKTFGKKHGSRFQLTGDYSSLLVNVINKFRSSTLLDKDLSENIMIASQNELIEANYDIQKTLFNKNEGGIKITRPSTTKLLTECNHLENEIKFIGNKIKLTISNILKS